MTAVAALGVYRAYRHTMHDRVIGYLGLHRSDDDYEYVTTEDDEADDPSSDPGSLPVMLNGEGIVSEPETPGSCRSAGVRFEPRITST